MLMFSLETPQRLPPLPHPSPDDTARTFSGAECVRRLSVTGKPLVSFLYSCLNVRLSVHKANASHEQIQENIRVVSDKMTEVSMNSSCLT